MNFGKFGSHAAENGDSVFYSSLLGMHLHSYARLISFCSTVCVKLVTRPGVR